MKAILLEAQTRTFTIYKYAKTATVSVSRLCSEARKHGAPYHALGWMGAWPSSRRRLYRSAMAANSHTSAE